MITDAALPAAAARIDIQDARRLRLAAEDRHRRRDHRLDHGRGARACSSRRPASAARCARSPTATRRRCRSAFRSSRSGSSCGSRPASSRWPPASCGARARTCRSRCEIIALKALPVLILGGFTSIPGAIVGGLIIGVGEKLGEFYWGPLLGGGIESWLAYVIALDLPAVPAAGPVRRTHHRADLRTHVLSRGRPVQDELRRRSWRSSRSGRTASASRVILLVAFVVIPLFGSSFLLQRGDDPVPGLLARGDRAQSSSPAIPGCSRSAPAPSWGSAPMPATSSRRFSRT